LTKIATAKAGPSHAFLRLLQGKTTSQRYAETVKRGAALRPAARLR
jgi:hypothetical protein